MIEQLIFHGLKVRTIKLPLIILVSSIIVGVLRTLISEKQTLASYFNQETKKALNFKISWNEIISNINYTSERGGYQTTFDRHKISDKHLKKLLLEGFEVNNVHDEDDIIIVSWRG